MSPSRGTCTVCGHPVLTLETAAWPVNGWEAERGSGGANQIIGRQRILDGRIAHAACVRLAAERQRHGIAAGQGSLL